MCNFLNIRKVKYLLTVLFLTFLIIPVRANIVQDADSVFNKNRTLKAEDLIRGERLFFGLVYLENKSVDCASCHNVRESDTLNWNPDALEISKKYQSKSASDLNTVLLKPAGKKLAEVHKELKLSPEDVIMIKAYMDRLVDSGLKQNKPVITNLLSSFPFLMEWVCGGYFISNPTLKRFFVICEVLANILKSRSRGAEIIKKIQKKWYIAIVKYLAIYRTK